MAAPSPDTVDGWALVTGGSSGLGRAVAVALSRRGYGVVVAARRKERLDEVVGAAPGPAAAVVVDLERTAEIGPALEAGLVGAGIAPESIRIVVNNAGAGSFGRFAEEDPEATRRTIRLGVDAPAAVAAWAIPHLRRGGGGVICNVSSVAAFTPGPLMASYYAAKSWLLSFGESLHEELKPEGIAVVTACPGPFASEFHRGAGIDVGRLGALPTADRVAEGVVRAIYRRRPVAPIGFFPRLWAVVGPRLPRAWSRRIVYALQRRREPPA